MKGVKGEEGITIIELLAVLAISSILLGSLVALIINSGRVTSHATTNITALEDIKAAVAPIVRDVRKAQYATISGDKQKLELEWINRDPPEYTETRYRCEYTYLEGGSSIEWSYWPDYDPQNPGEPESTRSFGRYLTGVEFESSGSGGEALIIVTLSSSPPGTGTGETLTYSVNMMFGKEGQ